MRCQIMKPGSHGPCGVCAGCMVDRDEGLFFTNIKRAVATLKGDAPEEPCADCEKLRSENALLKRSLTLLAEQTKGEK
jgi:hypothetical protein